MVKIIPMMNGTFGTVLIGILKELQDLEAGGHGSWRTSGDHPNYSIVENGQNTVKSPGDLRRLAVSQTPVKDYQLTLM